MPGKSLLMGLEQNTRGFSPEKKWYNEVGEDRNKWRKVLEKTKTHNKLWLLRLLFKL